MSNGTGGPSQFRWLMWIAIAIAIANVPLSFFYQPSFLGIIIDVSTAVLIFLLIIAQTRTFSGDTLGVLTVITIFEAFGPFIPYLGWAIKLIPVFAIYLFFRQDTTPHEGATGSVNRLVVSMSNMDFSTVVFVILLIIILLVGGLFFYRVYTAPGGVSEGWGGKMISFMKLSMETSKTSLDNMINFFPNFFERQVAIATGDYYTGQVDENAEEPLGVFIENLEPSSSFFYEDEPAIIWGTIRARTLSQDDKINVDLSCVANKDDKTKRVIGVMEPSNIKELYNLEEKDISCNFPTGKLPAGVNLVSFFATFNFPTQAYIKLYFIDKERRRTIERDQKDPLTFYNVPDKDPIAIYTAGPVRVGMDTLDPLISIDGPETEFRLGITVENEWLGQIKKVKTLTLKIPPTMEIPERSEGILDCDKSFVKEPCQGNECENGKYANVYRLKGRGDQGMISITDIKTFESFKCRVKIINPEATLGNVPVATHYFKVDIIYDYELEETSSADVRGTKAGGGLGGEDLNIPGIGDIGIGVTILPSGKKIGFEVYTEPKTPTTSDNIKCIGKNHDQDIDTALYQVFKVEEGNDVALMDHKQSAPCTPLLDRCAVEITKEFMKSKGVKKGDKIKCVIEAVGPDPQKEGAFKAYKGAAAVTLKNSLPKLMDLSYTPKAPVEGDALFFSASIEDYDEDEVSVYYEFQGIAKLAEKAPCIKGGEGNMTSNCAIQVEPEFVKAGTTIKASMTPYDGQDTGAVKSISVSVKAKT